jgi:hypothetical protein
LFCQINNHASRASTRPAEDNDDANLFFSIGMKPAVRRLKSGGHDANLLFPI